MIRGQRPTPGAKGAIDQLIIALGSAGAFQAAVDCFRAWLGRDRDRRIDIRWNSDGVEHSVTLTGEHNLQTLKGPVKDIAVLNRALAVPGTANDRTCAVVTLPGTGTTGLPLVVPATRGDTAAFPAPAKVTVQVTDWGGSSTGDLGLYDPVGGILLDFTTADKTPGDTVTLDPGGHKNAYLAIDACGVRVSAGT